MDSFISVKSNGEQSVLDISKQTNGKNAQPKQMNLLNACMNAIKEEEEHDKKQQLITTKRMYK